MPSAVIGALRVNLGLDSAQYNQGLKQAQKGAARFRKQFIAAIGTAASVAALRQLGQAVATAVDKLDEIAKTADGIGITTDALQELRVAADLSGVSAEALDTSMRRFARTASDARNGLSTAVRAFKAVAVSVTDAQGNLKPLDVLLADVADGFAGMTNATQKAATAQELFGRSGTTMVNLLNAGSAGIAEMRDEARRLGIVIDEDLIRQSVKAKDELTLMNKVIDAQLTRSLAELGPVLVGLAADLVVVARTAVEGYEGLRLLLGLASRNKVIRLGQIRDDLAAAREELAQLDKDFVAFSEKGLTSTASRLGFDDPNAPINAATAGGGTGAGPDPEVFNAKLAETAAQREDLVKRISDLNEELVRLKGEDVVLPPATVIGGGAGGGPGGAAAADLKKAFADILEGLDKEAAGLDLEAALLGKSTREAAAFRAETEALNEARAAGIELGPDERAQIELFADDVGFAAERYEQLAAEIDQGNRNLEEMRSLAGDVLGGLISDLRRSASAGDLLAGALERVASKLQDIALNALTGQGGSGGGGFLGSLISSIFGGGSALGGSGGGGFDLGFNLGTPISSDLGFAGNFAHGGSFEVGGMGGIDRNLVAFNASRGERVDIRRADQIDPGGRTEVNIYAPPGSSVSEERQQSADMERINIYIDKAVAGNMRPGTATHRALTSTFGVRAQPIKR